MASEPLLGTGIGRRRALSARAKIDLCAPRSIHALSKDHELHALSPSIGINQGARVKDFVGGEPGVSWPLRPEGFGGSLDPTRWR